MIRTERYIAASSGHVPRQQFRCKSGKLAMVLYGMVNVDLYSAIITKVSNALNTLVSGEKPGFQAHFRSLLAERTSKWRGFAPSSTNEEVVAASVDSASQRTESLIRSRRWRRRCRRPRGPRRTRSVTRAVEWTATGGWRCHRDCQEDAAASRPADARPSL